MHKSSTSRAHVYPLPCVADLESISLFFFHRLPLPVYIASLCFYKTQMQFTKQKTVK